MNRYTLLGATLLLLVVATVLAPNLRDAVHKSRSKHAAQRARFLGSALFTVHDTEQWIAPWANWREQRCAEVGSAGAHSIAMTASELERFVAQTPSLAAIAKELEPLDDLELGSFCNCASSQLWIKAGDVVWMDGYFVSRPSGLSDHDGNSQDWKIAGWQCDSVGPELSGDDAYSSAAAPLP